MEHTKLPWKTSWWIPEQGRKIMANSRCVAIVQTNKKGVLEADPKAEANAEYIVRACNAFAVMLEAINDLIEANQHARDLSLNRDEPHRGMIWGEARSMLDVAKLKAKAALAAGGEETK